MLNIRTQDNVPTTEEVVEILTRNNNRMGIPWDYDRACEYYAYYTMKGTKLQNQFRLITNWRKDIPLTDSRVIPWLKGHGVSEGLLLTEKGDISLSAASVEAAIETGLYSEEVALLLRKYVQAKMEFKKIASLAKIIKGSRVAAARTEEGHRILYLRPTWVPQNTGRVGCYNPGLLAMNKVIDDVKTVPKGWRYLSGDSSQIEPKAAASILFKDKQINRCANLYNDAYIGYVHYCTVLTDEQIKSGTLDFEAVPVTEEITGLRCKFKTWGNAVLYGSKENKSGDKMKEAFIRRIGGHPARVRHEAEVRRKIEQGERVFYTAFGTPIDITKGPSEEKYKDKSSDAYFNHLVRCAINNPIQGTAADLMRISVKKADNLLSRRAPNSVILKYVHDEGDFAICESDYNEVIEELRGITAYQVDDWIPISNDVEEGIHASSELPRLI